VIGVSLVQHVAPELESQCVEGFERVEFLQGEHAGAAAWLDDLLRFGARQQAVGCMLISLDDF
jgi:hypothetical protein